jgi:hypothetical protein
MLTYACFHQEIRTWLQDPSNRDRYLDDMVWFIHDRFGMVCSTTTCSKIKRKWLKVIEAEERGERLDPAEAQEQVRLDAFRVGKKPPGVSGNHDGQSGVESREKQAQTQTQNAAVSPTPSELSLPPTQVGTTIPMMLDMALLQRQQPLPQYAPQINQSLLRGYKPPQIDRQLQQQLQDEVAHAALHQH